HGHLGLAHARRTAPETQHAHGAVPAPLPEPG
ncbi:MAG: hypothetical protein QOG29_434, partial [Gaiellaceae bacterium]|nr:hypothetical protein [Gaiellaceae bacterium]